MRIGLITPGLQPAHGWGQYSRALVAALRQRGVSVTVAEPPLVPMLVPRPRGFSLRLLASAPRVERALAACDILHITAEPYAPLYAVGRARPALITVHGTYAHLPQQAAWPMNRAYAGAYRRAHLVCVSAYTAGVVQRIVPGATTSVINNGVDADRFRHLPPLDDPIAARGPVVLSVGAVKPRKGALELVRAIAAVRGQVPDVQCVIIGRPAEGAYAGQLASTIAELGLADSVHFLGHVDEATLLGWYGAASVFAMPSLNNGWQFEGFGLVHLEASAAGLPVIGSRGCGAEDAIDHGVTGLLVRQAAIAEELPAALLRILGDPALAQRMGQAGREKARAATWDRAAGQVIALYDELLT
jgi:phosphatidyl-myo-inositol dimannoside synthase